MTPGSGFPILVNVGQQFEERIKAQGDMKKKDIILNNFLGGLAWGLGTVVGATVVVALVGWILNMVGVLDGIKYFSAPAGSAFIK